MASRSVRDGVFERAEFGLNSPGGPRITDDNALGHDPNNDGSEFSV